MIEIVTRAPLYWWEHDGNGTGLVMNEYFDNGYRMDQGILNLLLFRSHALDVDAST